MTDFIDRCKKIRHRIVDAAGWGKRGHIPSALSLVEILVTLYDHVLQIDPAKQDDPDRDRFILSKGHGCLALYSVLVEKGFFPPTWLETFCHEDGPLGGHPEERVPGVEATTGSLGHGLSLAIGMALSARLQKRTFRTFVVLGDGECTEGSVWEAALSAGKHQLNNLVVLVDYNKLMSYGPTQDIGFLEPFADKWSSFGFEVRQADLTENPQALFPLLEPHTNKPLCIICHTIKGQGIAFMEGDLSWHHKSKIKDEDVEMMHRAIEDYRYA